MSLKAVAISWSFQSLFFRSSTSITGLTIRTRETIQTYGTKASIFSEQWSNFAIICSVNVVPTSCARSLEAEDAVPTFTHISFSLWIGVLTHVVFEFPELVVRQRHRTKDRSVTSIVIAGYLTTKRYQLIFCDAGLVISFFATAIGVMSKLTITGGNTFSSLKLGFFNASLSLFFSLSFSKPLFFVPFLFNL